jgi:hypothetical protein
MLIGGSTSTNSISYSKDGLTWAASTSANTLFNFLVNNIVWNGKLWVANSYQKLAYSTDGINWTVSTSGTSFTQQPYGIASNGNIWIAVTNWNIAVAYSNDGITWSTLSSANAIFGPNGVAYSVKWNGKMWVIGAQGTLMAYSTDPQGQSWTQTISPLTNIMYGIDYSGSLWVAVGDGVSATDITVCYSYDGIVWQISTSGSSLLKRGLRVVWGGNIWVAGGFKLSGSGSYLIYSFDGINWAACSGSDIATYMTGIYGISYNGSFWIAVGSSGTANRTSLISYNGIDWTSATGANKMNASQANSVASRRYINNSPDTLTPVPSEKFMIIGSNTYTNNINMIYSYDGLTWLQSRSAVSVFSGAVNKIFKSKVQ